MWFGRQEATLGGDSMFYPAQRNVSLNVAFRRPHYTDVTSQNTVASRRSCSAHYFTRLKAKAILVTIMTHITPEAMSRFFKKNLGSKYSDP